MRSFVPTCIMLLLASGACMPTVYADDFENEAENPEQQMNNEDRNRWGLGIGVGAQSRIYKEYDSRVSAMPFVSYEGDLFFIRGLSAGVNLYNEGGHNIFADISYEYLNFNPKDTDDVQLKKLDRRRSTAMAGFGYRYRDTWGVVHLRASADILGKSNGILLDAGYMYPIMVGNMRVVPGIGVEWASKNHNDYYYGVSKEESLRSGLYAYESDNDISPYIDVSIQYTIQKDWGIFMRGRVNALGNSVKDSPMVDKNYGAAVGMGVKYSF